MCNSINGYGNGNGNGGGEEWDPSSKKQRNQHNKPRQRGLGVAKLEKILREQKDKEENKVAVVEFSSRLLSALPRKYQPPSSSFLRPAAQPPPMAMMSTLPSSSTTCIPFGPSTFTMPIFYGNAGVNSNTGVGDGGGGGGFAEPDAAGCGCFRNSCEASLRGEGPHKDSRIESNRINAVAPLVLQREQQHTYQSPTMNPPSLMSAAWSTAFSAGRIHEIEHPSNQRPYADYSFIRPEEQKMAGTKRPWPFSGDQTPGLYYPNPFPADKKKAYQLPSCGHDSAITLEPAETVSREANRSSHFGQNSRRCFKDCSSSDGHFLTLGPPESHSPPGQTSKLDFSQVNLRPFEGVCLCLKGCMEGHHQWPTDPKPGRSIHQKPSTEGHMGRKETSLRLNYLIDEAEEDSSIDLDLKL